MRILTLLLLTVSACGEAAAVEADDTAGAPSDPPTLVAEIRPIDPVAATYPSPPMAHLRCTALYDITNPEGRLIGSWCAFGIRTNGVDRTCLVTTDGTGALVCL